jgi:hypothetical protein
VTDRRHEIGECQDCKWWRHDPVDDDDWAECDGIRRRGEQPAWLWGNKTAELHTLRGFGCLMWGAKDG